MLILVALYQYYSPFNPLSQCRKIYFELFKIHIGVVILSPFHLARKAGKVTHFLDNYVIGVNRAD
jgi:hypothetical protein